MFYDLKNMLERTKQSIEQGSDEISLKSEGAPSLLSRIVEKVRRVSLLFIVCVILPSLLAFLYFGFFASDVYISESRFVVRSPEKAPSAGLGVILKSAGFANAGDEIYAAQNYVTSRDALRALDRNGAIRDAYEASSISIFDRFGSFLTGRSSEELYKYYQDKVKIGFDTSSSIVTLTVRAYSPGDARKFNEQLLEMAEATVNRLNSRGRQDMIQFAAGEVEDAKRNARDAALALSNYRNREGVVDPEKQAAVQLQMISKLQDELIASRTQLRELQKIAPVNPQIETLRARISGLSDEIDDQVKQVAGNRSSLSSSTPQYERLLLESQFADKQLASSMASFEEARNEARRKQAYVERIVQPNLPDHSLEPRRLRLILATVVMGLLAWGVLSMLFAGVREHRN